MCALSRDEILALNDIQTKEIHVPEWNSTVFIRMFSGAERAALHDALKRYGSDDPGDSLEQIVSMGLSDSSGRRLFSAEDVSLLGKKSLKALQNLCFEILDFSRSTAQSAEEVEKNSEPGQNASSTSTSPNDSAAQ